jgi:hypothetical protein
MKTNLFRFLSPLSKIQKQHIQFFFMALTILMLVLGAGAPADVGGVGH